MANVLISEDTMTDIADAIRSKKGVSTTYKPSDMPSAIESISGGITPTGTINIATNGTHDVTNYASANVAVPQGITPTGTKQISITENGTTTEDVTNYASAQITVNVQSGGDFEAFMKHTISDYEDDFTTWVPARFIGGSFPNLTRIRLNNAVGFSGSPYFHFIVIGRNDMKVIMPKCTGAKMNAFNGSTSLKVFDFLGGSKLESQMFYGCTNFNTFIIRKTDSVVPLDNINVFYNTPFASGKAGGTLYVPSALISSYQSAANWSTILGYANNQILSIEGSIYKTQYADETPISA